MRCGKGHDHGTVAEVRACYGQTSSNYSTGSGTGRDWRSEPASYKQYQLLARLRSELQVAARYSGEMTKGQASEEITDLKNYGEAQRKAKAPARVPVAPNAMDHADRTPSPEPKRARQQF